MSTETNSINESDVFKAIGHLDEATQEMASDAVKSDDESEEIVGILTIIGRVIKNIFEP